jgi:hypothetical protein
MRPTNRLMFTVALLALVATMAMGQQERTQKFVLELKTSMRPSAFKMPVIPGMPTIPNMPDLSALFGKTSATRNINGQAVYPDKAVDPIFVLVPADLTLPDNKLVLKVSKPFRIPEGLTEPETPTTPTIPQRMKFTSKLYWHPTVAEGLTVTSLDVDLSKTRSTGGGAAPGPGNLDDQWMLDMEKSASGSESKLPATAVGHGSYVLNTGGTAVLDGFLPAIQVTTPDDISAVKLEDGIDVQWQPVTGARGFILHATAMAGDPGAAQTFTTWVSTLHEPPARVLNGYEQDTSISDDLANGILLPPTTTQCMVPPGIFDSAARTFTLTATAVGNDFYDTTGGITVRGKIRSEWSATKMPGMGFPGMGGATPGGMTLPPAMPPGFKLPPGLPAGLNIPGAGG